MVSRLASKRLARSVGVTRWAKNIEAMDIGNENVSLAVIALIRMITRKISGRSESRDLVDLLGRNQTFCSFGANAKTTSPNKKCCPFLKETCDKLECGLHSVHHVYCYGCDALSHGICREHPLIFVINRPVKMEADAMDTFPKFFHLQKSTITEAGMGVFTKAFLPAGATFGPYGGFLLFDDDSRINSNYSWEIEVPMGKKKISVDASDPNRSNYLRWINCARCKEEQNMIALQFHERMYYVVIKPVYPGQELLVWYGDAYAERLKIGNLRRSTDLYAPPKAKRDPKAIMAAWIYDDQKPETSETQDPKPEAQ